MFSVEDATDSLQSEGYVAIHDPLVGDRVSDLADNKFPFRTEYGLEFCKVNVLNDKRVRQLLERLYERSYLGLYLKWGEDPGHILCFRRGGEKAFHVLIVQLWSKGSQATFYSRSHLSPLPTFRTASAMYETPLASLKQAGCGGEEIHFEHGGLTILDARVSFEIKQGYAITFAFTTKHILEAENWAKMVLPNLPSLEKKVDDMDSATVGVNFAFKS